MRDVRVIQGGEDFRLTLESGEPIGITGDRLGQHLDGDGTFQIRVDGPIHLSHAADADEGHDFVWTETSAGLEWQGACGLYAPYSGTTRYALTLFGR